MSKFLKAGSQKWVLQLRPVRATELADVRPGGTGSEDEDARPGGQATKDKVLRPGGQTTKDKSLGLVGRAKEVQDRLYRIKCFQGNFYK